MSHKKIILGLMSGTSCDGLTVCAVLPHPFKILGFKNYPYTIALQKRLLLASQCQAAELSSLHFELGKLYAQKTLLFLKQFRFKKEDIFAVGMHGQTVYHGPNDAQPNTLQIAEPSFLAEALGRPVVSNFRERDIVSGGEGAPLIPFFDEYLFGKSAPKILLNLGGISNISVVGKGVKTQGFDCGPANTLMDLACEKFLNIPFDKNGALAMQGKPNFSLIKKLLKQSYFSAKPPKSLDKNQFGKAYLEKYFSAYSAKNIYDLLATLNLFTAAAVADAIERFVPKKLQKEIIVSGGGTYNKTLLLNLQKQTGIPVKTSSQIGIDPQAKEAAAFAVMAWLTLQRKSNHCPQATGAKKKVILGRITL